MSMTQTVGLLLGWGLVRYNLLPFIQNHAQVHLMSKVSNSWI